MLTEAVWSDILHLGLLQFLGIHSLNVRWCSFLEKPWHRVTSFLICNLWIIYRSCFLAGAKNRQDHLSISACILFSFVIAWTPPPLPVLVSGSNKSLLSAWSISSSCPWSRTRYYEAYIRYVHDVNAHRASKHIGFVYDCHKTCESFWPFNPKNDKWASLYSIYVVTGWISSLWESNSMTIRIITICTNPLSKSFDIFAMICKFIYKSFIHSRAY